MSSIFVDAYNSFQGSHGFCILLSHPESLSRTMLQKNMHQTGPIMPIPARKGRKLAKNWTFTFIHNGRLPATPLGRQWRYSQQD